MATSCFADAAYFTAHNNGNTTVSLAVGYREVTVGGTTVWYSALQFGLGPGQTLTGSATTGYHQLVEMKLVLDDGLGTILDDGMCAASGGSVDLYVVSNNKPAKDANDRGKRGSPPDCGMPVWGVSEPYLALWFDDEPLGYQPALGPRVSFALAWKQRETEIGSDPGIFGFGPNWNFSWMSYVAKDAKGSNVVYLPGGGSLTYTNELEFLTNTRLSGDTTNGFTRSFPDGRKDAYNFVVTNSSGVFQKAFLTEHWNSINQKTRLEYYSYNPSSIVIRLKDVVDGDGRTNNVSYVASNGYSTNLISQVTDGFNRNAVFGYDNSGHLTSITDVAGLTSNFGYGPNNWITNLVTPYGRTGFRIADMAVLNGRYLEVTEPDGSKQLYLHTNNAPGVSSYYSTNQIPNTYPYSNTFETNSLDVRNTFHWGRLQYSNLSTNFLLTDEVSQLQSSDYLKAHMKHWLLAASSTVSEVLSMERQPSPDGTTEGQKTWYDHAGKTNINYTGTQVLPLLVANVLPDRTTSFVRSDRNSLGNPTTNASTYSIGANVLLRTNFYGYATNNIDLVTATNALVTGTNSLGVQVSSNYFNSYHQVLTNFDALNELTVYTYNTNQQLTSVTRPNGLVTTNIYFNNGFTNWLDRTMDFSGSTYFRTNAFAYGANGLVCSQTDARGLTITNYWDNLQRLSGRLYPDGTTTSNLYYRLDGQSYPNSSGGTNLLDLTATRDRLTNWIYFAYDAMRRTIYETNALGTVTAYGFCQCGALEYVTNALGKAEQLVTHHVHDNQGRITSTFYPDGSAMTNQYDSLGRLTNTVSGFASVTNYYNNQGLVTASSNAFGRVLSATYDVLDRATNTANANGVTITNTYDNLSRPLAKSYPDGGVEKFVYTLNIAGVTSYTNQLGSNVVNYAYDALGRKTNEVNPGISTNSFAYDAGGSLTNLTDGKGQITRWNYDQYGRTTNKVDATSTEIFRYQYDADNRLTNRWSAAKGATTYKYDTVGNLTNAVYPVSPALTMKYDSLSRLTNMVDATGTTVYGYANQFLASEDGPWENDTVSYGYQNGLRSSFSLRQPNASSWMQSYGYDAANRLNSLSSPAGAFTPTYKGPGNLVTNLALPNGSAISNAFESAARLTGTWLKSSAGTILNSHVYGYNLAGQRSAVTNFAGNYLNYTYDLIGELKTASGKESGGSSRLHEQFGYAYDAAGNLNYRTNNALVQTFTNNSLNELTTVDRSGTLTVAGTTTSAATSVTVNTLTATLYGDKTFSKEGFTLASGTNTYTAIAQDTYNRKDTNAVTVNLPGTVSYIYDLNGNLTSDGTRGFDYDDENQLIRVIVTNSWKSEFTYDGKFRRRIRKEFTWQNSTWVPMSEVHYIYDGNVVIQERNGLNLPQVTYTRAASRLLARSDMTEPAPIHAFFHADGNGNITVLINAQQILVAKYAYDPFGNTLSLSGPNATANLYRFASQELHPNSGLVLYLRRSYDPNLQRFLNRDPIVERGGLNLYGFVGNNPISSSDPLGLCKTWWKPWTWFDPDAGDNLELPNGEWYGPSLLPNFQPPDENDPTSDKNLAKISNGGMQLGEENAHEASKKVVILGVAVAVTAATLPIGGEGEALEGGALEAGVAKEGTTAAQEAANLAYNVVDPNKLRHIFDNAQHDLGNVVAHFGGDQTAAFQAIESATQQVVSSEGIQGVFQTTVNVAGETITVRGNVINGVVKIGTAFK